MSTAREIKEFLEKKGLRNVAFLSISEIRNKLTPNDRAQLLETIRKSGSKTSINYQKYSDIVFKYTGIKIESDTLMCYGSGPVTEFEISEIVTGIAVDEGFVAEKCAPRVYMVHLKSLTEIIYFVGGIKYCIDQEKFLRLCMKLVSWFRFKYDENKTLKRRFRSIFPTEPPAIDIVTNILKNIADNLEKTELDKDPFSHAVFPVALKYISQISGIILSMGKIDGLSEIAEDGCPICFSKINVDECFVIKPCKHELHADCAKKCFVDMGETKCPLCRTNISKDSIDALFTV